VPYGIDPVQFQGKKRERSAYLHVLYVGTVQLRKGIQYFLEAAESIGPGKMVFRCVGPVDVSDDATRRLAGVMDLAGPVPRAVMQSEYDWADVLVLPSLSEGSANVCLEAMACGLPVITTLQAGSAVRDGKDGYIVPIRDGKAVADRLAVLASDRALLDELAENASGRALEFTWEKYAERLVGVIAGLA
jgi:glycosyltransferase involved in cell wall biosynthesis